MNGGEYMALVFAVIFVCAYLWMSDRLDKQERGDE